MKPMRVFCIMLISTILLSFSSLPIFAESIADSEDIFIMSNYEDEYTNDVHEENGWGIVVFSEEGETVIEFIIDVPDFEEDLISEIVGKMIFEESNQKNGEEPSYQEVKPSGITCCDRTSWRRYKLEVHSRTSPTCYVDVYDFFVCDNCGASYREYKESYSHLRANCPY
ncbi:hypothetical protein [Tissierella carlieri]|jgi:hypothetical protein|uniref:C2H2-type domain-containing protein n=1 Tax=Tissierella carlieri TaxID=689904 RepID=A0ABT1S9H4_9FIRM|nr:hypothetical protein [Tissierella carlieri]MCQ4922995.1 hypothetical protein [Tissierella carlieri]MDU5081960.1 hypothetical protein [Bacillota bacterium]